MDDIVGDVSNRDEVLEAIHGAFDDDIWVERNMYSLNGARKYLASWEQFCDAVKHEAKHDTPPEETSSITTPFRCGRCSRSCRKSRATPG
jgi:hypothetical protein